MSDQNAIRPLLAAPGAIIMALFKGPHCAQGVGPYLPHQAGSHRRSQPLADAVIAGVEQTLLATVALISNPVTAATVAGAIAGIDVTEPRTELEGQAVYPFVLDLRERLN